MMSYETDFIYEGGERLVRISEPTGEYYQGGAGVCNAEEARALAAKLIEFAEEESSECFCVACQRERDGMLSTMPGCESCGNKRCPQATGHWLACTGSNEPGQLGSVY